MKISKGLLGKFGAEWERACYDILFFARHFMRFDPTEDQRLLLLHAQYATFYDTPGMKRVLARSGQGCGKTAVLCIIVLWRHLRAPGTLTVITAPTNAQCREVFFAELRRRVVVAHPVIQGLMHIAATRAYVKDPKWDDGWAIISRTATDSDCLRGLHHPNMTVVVEEMSGVSGDVMETMVGTCSQEDNLILGIGNPSRREGYFYKAFMDPKVAGNWQRSMKLSRKKLSEERPDICRPENIEALAREWGIDSDPYRVNVLGDFPKVGGDTVLPLEWVMKAMATPAFDAMQVDPLARVIALDFARFGGDENVVARRHGNALSEMWAAGMMDPSQGVYRAKHMAISNGWRPGDFKFHADATGIGQGMIQPLREPVDGMHEFEDFDVREWHNHSSSIEFNKKYANLISRAWFELREKLYEFCERDGPPVSLPNDDTLREQLVSMKYKFDNKNRFKVFTKDEYRKEYANNNELGPSPDRAETVVMAMSDVDIGSTRIAVQGEDERWSRPA